MKLRWGWVEGVDILLRHRKLADALEINDYWATQLDALFDAQATIWLSGDKELISGASDIIASVGEVIGIYTALPKKVIDDPTATSIGKVERRFRKLKPFPADPEGDIARTDSVRDLVRVCIVFGELMRKKLGMDDIDAIIKAFPKFQTENLASRPQVLAPPIRRNV